MLMSSRMRSLVALVAVLLLAPATASSQPTDTEEDEDGAKAQPDSGSMDEPPDDGEAEPVERTADERAPKRGLHAAPAKADTAQESISTSQATAAQAISVAGGTATPTGFAFGSYGRVGLGSDLRGATPEPTNVVLKGSRVVENDYTELDMYYHMRTRDGVRVKTVTTLAFAGEPFHYTGSFDTHLALRNFYANAEVTDAFSLWVGSRMYRGDDIYLLDYWPLDDLNTIGGGLGYRRDKLEIGVHAGANRLLDPFQYQEREVSDPLFGSTTIVAMDRQRMVASATTTYRLLDTPGGVGAKAKMYFEVQGLPSGSRIREDDTREDLPSDFGWTIGGQLGAWGFADGLSHANLFLRFSQGLTAFDELQLPTGFDATKKTFPGVTELVLAFSGNYERGPTSTMLGGYLRRFSDADPNTEDRDDGWEYIADVRTMATLSRGFGAGLDLSYQARFPGGLSPTMLVALDPAVFQVAPMLIYSPFGSGSYARPQFRLLYRAAHLNEGARDLYPLDDLRRDTTWVHYLGVQAEWWFNSSYR